MTSIDIASESTPGFDFNHRFADIITRASRDASPSLRALVASYLHEAESYDRASVEITPDSHAIADSSAKQIGETCDRLISLYPSSPAALDGSLTAVTALCDRLVILTLLINSSNYIIDEDIEHFAYARLSDLSASSSLTPSGRIIVSLLADPSREISSSLSSLSVSDSLTDFALSLASLVKYE